MKSFALFFLPLLTSTSAFVPPIRAVTTRSLILNALEETVPSDAFDNYSQSDSDQLAIKETVVGTGEEAEIGKVVTVAYQGRLMSTGKQFDKGVGFSFRLGDGNVIPGKLILDGSRFYKISETYVKAF